MREDKEKNYLKLLIVLFVFASSACTHVQSKPLKFQVQSWNTMKWQHVERQGYDYSCGAAALATLAQGYFGDPLEETLVLQMLLTNLSSQEEKVDRVANGFSMLDLQQAAHRFGYDAIGVKLPTDAVFKIKGPIIIILGDDEFEHFVVFKGIHEGKAYMSDSFQGNVRMPLSTFFKQWNRTALILGKAGTELRGNHFLAIKPSEKDNSEIYSYRALRSTNFWIR